MSSNTAAANADAAQQNNFNPSWMRSAFHGGGVTASPRASTNEEELDYPVCAPVFVQNRYGREDVLALLGQPDNGPPDGLSECHFYVPTPQQPIVCYPLSDLEQRLQQNVNSSKAMSQLSHAERASVASGAAYSGGSPNGAPVGGGSSRVAAASAAAAGGGWTPVKSNTWSRGTSNPNSASSISRGGTSRPYVPARGGARPNESPVTGGSGEEPMPFAQRFSQYTATRGGRGGPTVARGASTNANSFNSRAQGLYDPRDPKDRPRNRLRSTSDEGDAAAAEPVRTNGSSAATGGWTTAGAPARQPSWARENSTGGGNGAPAGTPWNKEGSWGISRENSHSSVGAAWKGESAGGPMPEWMDDDVAKPTSNNDSSGPVASGSFDEKGRFRADENVAKVEEHVPVNPPANPWTSQQMAQQSSMPSTLASQQSAQQPSVYSSTSAYTGGMTAAPPPVRPPVPRSPPTFYYLDPNNQERGPFEKNQMDAWFSSGYFNDKLQVRRNFDVTFKTLGELKQLNSAMLPFDYRDEVAPVPPQPQYPQSTFANMFSSTGVWKDSSMGNPYGQHQMYDPIAMERKRIEEQQRQLMEEQLKIREQEMMKLVQRQAEEQAKIILERERALKQKEEEMSQRLDAERMEREMEQMKLAEKVRMLEAEKQAREDAERNAVERAQKKSEDAKRAEAEKRKALKELEEAKKREETERRKRSEEAAEEHKRKLQQKAEQDASKIREAQLAKQEAARRAEEERREAASAAKAAEKMFDIEEAWEQPSKKKSGPSGDADAGWTTQSAVKKSAAPKAAPWVASAAAAREKTLKEIQEEEEKQLEAERKEQARIRKEQEATAASVRQMSAGSWSNASSRISWNQPSLSSSSSNKGAVAWGGAALEQNKPVAPSPFWDGPTLAAANRVAPVAKKGAPAKAPAKQPAPAPAPKKEEKKRSDAFLSWVVSRLKELNSTVEAEVLASFLESVENPNEVEDYVEGYLGSSKASKEFVKEFLSKRCEMRKRKGTTQKDDLSSASVAPAAGNSSGAQGKKKKGKGTKMDGSLLGFRPAGDPNRLNQGEIETIPPLSSGRR